MLIEPLALTTPISAFNGGLIVGPDMSVLEQKTIPETVVDPAIALLSAVGLDVWLYRDADWLRARPHSPPRGPGVEHGEVPANGGREL